MKGLFLITVFTACALLGTAMVLIDSGLFSLSIFCTLGALIAFLVAYQLQTHYSLLDDE
ncbi:hypothetical protein QWZ13_19305 [Reinekea marina]|uniref:Uncharacterized protein n=1 Tax=Reinekea marina TaxID=1310421 RepID=A0ABV7WRS8_9GAMM|nr:hypothetical protein [Reinekea marina]MBU2864170.1 hypothetical protein [Reinekea forsetii]MDN3647307.1 hypothetical protein [Reinekea marina]MDN3651063.1 hypothetical protein [Reinekea marina]